MNLGQLIKLARTRLRDKNPAKYKWEDDELIEFANSAVAEAVIRSRSLQKRVILPLSAGVEDLQLPGTVLKLQGCLFLDHSGPTVTAGNFGVSRWYMVVTPGTTDFTLLGATSNLAGTVFRATGIGSGTGTATLCNETPLIPMSQEDYYNARAYLRTTPTRPTHFMRGLTANIITVYPISMFEGSVVADIVRLTTEEDEMVTQYDEPVIPVEFHRDLVYWMLAEAYQVHDSDKLDPGAAEKNEAKFELRFGKKISARAELQGRRNVVGSDMRPAVFGGSVKQSFKY